MILTVPHSDGAVLPREAASTGAPLYDLFAVANHLGNAHGGHYTAHCQNSGDLQWYEFNDEQVSRMSAQEIGQPSSASYVLLYRITQSSNGYSTGGDTSSASHSRRYSGDRIPSAL